jgi:cytochrome c
VPVAIRKSIRFLLFPLGLAQLLAALLFRGGTALISGQQQTMPTPDRLAEPTLPASPTQADNGAQVYWLSCLPCHGERGQGLTDEFRTAYPPEDRDCWASGCHGERPYADGFTLPKIIPAVIGPGSLQKFPNADVLRAYIFAAMPFWKPGSLTEQEAWQVTAFVLRANGLWEAREELNAYNADRILVAGSGVPSGPSALPEAGGSFRLFAAGLGVLIFLLIFQQILGKRTGS